MPLPDNGEQVEAIEDEEFEPAPSLEQRVVAELPRANARVAAQAGPP